MRIDLGTGDGRAVSAAAAAAPERLVIGVDANATAMVEVSRRTQRPAQRGGLPNALFVVAGVERLPAALTGIADEVTVYFPWGSLLRGLVTAEPAVLDGIAGTMKSGATLSVLLSVTDQDRAVDLPVTDAATLWQLRGPFAAAGLEITGIGAATAAEIAAAGSSWGKRLGAGNRRPAWRLGAEKR